VFHLSVPFVVAVQTSHILMISLGTNVSIILAQYNWTLNCFKHVEHHVIWARFVVHMRKVLNWYFVDLFQINQSIFSYVRINPVVGVNEFLEPSNFCILGVVDLHHDCNCLTIFKFIQQIANSFRFRQFRILRMHQMIPQTDV
jgi:hypothetical protein